MTTQAQGPPLFDGRKSQVLAALDRIDRALVADAVAVVTSPAIRVRFERLIGQATIAVEEATDWRALAAADVRLVRPLKVEALAYLQAALFRAAGLDGGLGGVAQRMLDGLAERAGVERQVLLAVAEAEFTGHTASMIRLPFPDSTVWRLPVLAHEFGHHVAYALRDPAPGAAAPLPIEAWLRGQAGSKGELSRFHELFADVYACYALGATYPICAIVLDARPDERFDEDHDTHPSWPRRVATMIAALRAMGGAFALSAGRRVEPLWQSVTDVEYRLSRAEHVMVEDQAAELVRLLRQHTPARARFVSDGRETELAENMYDVDPPPPAADVTIPEVVAAAWCWRLRNPAAPEFALDTVSRNALRWCAEAQL